MGQDWRPGTRLDALAWQRAITERELVAAQRRVAELEEQLERLLSESRHAQSETTISADGTPAPCAGCGRPIVTEADMTAHYLVPDPRYPNLGYCPRRDRARDGAHAE